jgi:hypothetical protein
MLTSRLVVGAGDGCSNLLGSRSQLALDCDASTSVERQRGVDLGMAYLRGTPRMLPDQPVPTIDPEVERLAHVMVDGLIARLAAEPVGPATSLLDNLADQLQQAARMRRFNVVRRTPGSASAASWPATPQRAASQHPAKEQPHGDS